MCLRDDFRLYYNGTWITKRVDGVRRVMMVEDVMGSGARRPNQVQLHGHCYGWSPSGLVDHGREAWGGHEIEPYVPESGYYKIGPSGTPGYLEYVPQNRTNRKGFESGRIMVNNRHTGLQTPQVVRVFCDEPMQGRVFSDMCIHKNRFYWRGEDVGTFHDGVLTLREDVQYIQDYAEKQINKFLNK